MIRLKQFVIGLCCIAAVSAQANEMAFKTLALPSFTKVSSQYINDLEVIGGHKNASVVLSGDASLFPYVDAKVRDGELQIRAPEGVHVIVRPDVLDSVRVVGEGYFDAKALNRARSLSLSLSGDVVAHVRGPIPLKHVTATGDTSLTLYWLDTEKFLLELGQQAQVEISGRCGHGEYRVTDRAVLDAKWLRCQEITSQTSGMAYASIQAVDGLTAYAGGKSQMNYYASPRRLTKFSSEYGQVLEALHAHDND